LKIKAVGKWASQFLTFKTTKHWLHKQGVFSDITELYFIIQFNTVGLRKM
jgi:hypothetical protein